MTAHGAGVVERVGAEPVGDAGEADNVGAGEPDRVVRGGVGIVADDAWAVEDVGVRDGEELGEECRGHCVGWGFWIGFWGF